MKLRSIRAIPLRYPEPNDFGAQRMTVLVRAETESGLTGWGEAIAMWPEACKAAISIIEEGLGPLLLGKDAREVERHWQAMKAHTWWYGEGGIASFAISGIDMALWDIAGRAAGVPLWLLLGGQSRPRLPACASTHPSLPTHEANAEELAGYIAAGYQSVKVGFGKRGDAGLGRDPDVDVAFVRKVRERIGPAAGFMVDIGNAVSWDVATAIRTTRRFEEHRIAWIEEPLHPDDIDGLRLLRAATQTAIATGEREWTVDRYRKLLAADVTDIFGIDPGRSEGITGFRKAATLIGAARRHFNAHAWSTAITSSASLSLSVALGNCHLFEFKPKRNPMQHELVAEPIDPVDGWAVPPSGPGLGVTVLEDVVEHYRAR